MISCLMPSVVRNLKYITVYVLNHNQFEQNKKLICFLSTSSDWLLCLEWSRPLTSVKVLSVFLVGVTVDT